MPVAERLDIYTPFLRKERDEAGILWVEGKFTGPDLDSDGQRMDPTWLKAAIPAYMHGPSGGNVREGHSAQRPIGKAVEVWETDDHSWHMRAKIVDPVAEAKIEHGILTGFSVGVANYGLAKATDAPNGKVCRGDVIEVSAVDRPSLPSALFRMAALNKATGSLDLVDSPEFVEGDEVEKAVDAVPVAPGPQMLLKTSDGRVLPMTAALVDQLTAPSVVANPDDPDAADPETLAKRKKAGKFGGRKAKPFQSEDGGQGGSDPDGDGVHNRDDEDDDGDGKPDSEDADDTGSAKSSSKAVEPDFDTLIKAVATELEKRKFTAGEREDAAAAGEAMPSGGFPIQNRAQLNDAIQAFGRAKDPAAAKKHITDRAKALDATDLLPADWPGSTKPKEKATAPDVVKADDGDEGGLQLTDNAAAASEMDDIAAAKAVIQGLACLIRSEAMGLFLGELGEVADIALLAQAAELVTWFMRNEAMEIKHMTEPDAGALSEPTEDGAEKAGTPDLMKAAAEKAAKKMRKRLKKAAAAAAATHAGEAGTETPAEPDMAKAASTTDTDTLTKAITARVSADLAAQFGDAITKAMEPLAQGLAEVKATLHETPRPGGPARTRVQPPVSPAELAKTAEADVKKGVLRAMRDAPGADPAMRAEIQRQLDALDPPAAA